MADWLAFRHPNMLLFDAFIRFTGVGLLVLLAIFSARDLKSWHGARYLLLASISVLGAFLGFTIEPFRLPEIPHAIARLADMPHLVFVWLFALSVFERKFKARPFHLLVGGIYILPMLATRLYQFGLATWDPRPIALVAEVFSVALMTHLIIVSLRGRADDLLEKRRRARIYFVIVIVFVAVSAALVEATGFRPLGMAFQTLWIATVWPGIVWTCFWLLGANPAVLAFDDAKIPSAPASAQDQKLLAALDEIMTGQQAFRTADLKITTLAKQLAVTQHRLRALINQTLGHQNFNGFVNSYRIAAAKSALQDPDKANLPILTIAMDCGFNSLSPFNRAFRESENMTPSEFRRSLTPSQ